MIFSLILNTVLEIRAIQVFLVQENSKRSIFHFFEELKNYFSGQNIHHPVKESFWHSFLTCVMSFCLLGKSK